jgi:hypothetical protein
MSDKPFRLLPSGVEVDRLVVTLSQEEDTCGRAGEHYQTLEVLIENNGMGVYPVLKTERWAMDDDEILTFARWLHDLVSLCG